MDKPTKSETSSDTELKQLDQQIDKSKLKEEIIIEESGPLETLYEWEAPERVFTPRSRKWYVGVAAIAMVFIVYSALTVNFILIFLVIALVLVVYALNSIPPQKAEFKITNKGIQAFNNLYIWKNLDSFWVTKRGENYMVNFDFREKVTDAYLQRMIMLANKSNVNQVVSHLVRHVDYKSLNSSSILSQFVEGKYVPLMSIVKLGEKKVEEKI